MALNTEKSMEDIAKMCNDPKLVVPGRIHIRDGPLVKVSWPASPAVPLPPATPLPNHALDQQYNCFAVPSFVCLQL